MQILINLKRKEKIKQNKKYLLKYDQSLYIILGLLAICDYRNGKNNLHNKSFMRK